MKIEEIEGLYPKERELLKILRCFEFLKTENYCPNQISYCGRDYPSLIYLNNINKIRLHIIAVDSYYTIQIQRYKPFALKKESYVFDIRDYYSSFGSTMLKGKNYSLKSQADFIQQYLMPVLRGEKWVNEI